MFCTVYFTDNCSQAFLGGNYKRISVYSEYYRHQSKNSILGTCVSLSDIFKFYNFLTLLYTINENVILHLKKMNTQHTCLSEEECLDSEVFATGLGVGDCLLVLIGGPNKSAKALLPLFSSGL